MTILQKIKFPAVGKCLFSLPVFLLGLTITASFVYQVNFRNKHFQECDSSGVFYQLKNFPTSGLNFIALSYQDSEGLISRDRAYQILDNPKLSAITNPLYKKYSKDLIAEKLSRSSPIAAFRYAEISLLGTTPIPYFLRTALSLPLTTTYSPAAGLFYGLITSPYTAYSDFMSRIIILNLFLFHVAALLLYLSARKLKIDRWPAALTTLIFLFSISLYSSGFSAGSTIWMIFSEMLWIYLLATRLTSPNLLKTISVMSGVLIFFNYLISLFWLSFIIAYWIKLRQTQPKTNLKAVFSEIANLFWTQKTAFLLFIICVVCFYPPGQGVRATGEISHLIKDVYYIILNFFAFYTTPGSGQIIQFTIAFALTGWALFYLIVNRKTNILFSTVFYFFIIYLITVVLKILGFGPTRHMLFLAPPLFLTLALSLQPFWDNIVKSSKIVIYFNVALFILLATLGFWGLHTRHLSAFDLTTTIKIDWDVNQVGIFDCSYNLLYRNWQPASSVNFINPKNFQPGQTYLYISQTTDFSSALKEWQKNYIINMEEFNVVQKETNTYFIAFNPGFINKSLIYSRPNNIYTAKFKINSIVNR